MSTFDRLFRIAKQQHQEQQNSIKEELAKVELIAAVEARKKDIMTAEERKEYLTRIIRGEIEIPTKEVRWDGVGKKFVTIPFVELPNHSARINAISELNKMKGDYAETSIKLRGDKNALLDIYINGKRIGQE